MSGADANARAAASEESGIIVSVFCLLHGLDRRLVDERKRASALRNFKPYVLAITVLVLFAVAYLAIFVMPSPVVNAAVQQPATDAQTHVHGDIVVEVDDVQYIEQDGRFHFHANDDAEQWHVHCEDVTLEYAMMTLGMDVSDDTLVVDGERFTTDDGTTVSVTVDGEPVDPEQYVLQDGDDVRIVVETDE